VLNFFLAFPGALLYLKSEFHLEAAPALEGFVVASTLFGAVASVTVAGPAADWLGRKFMLCISGILYCVAAMIMLWAPSVQVLILSRVIVGLAIGLASTHFDLRVRPSRHSRPTCNVPSAPGILRALLRLRHGLHPVPPGESQLAGHAGHLGRSIFPLRRPLLSRLAGVPSLARQQRTHARRQASATKPPRP
jgi:MFS family permease